MFDRDTRLSLGARHTRLGVALVGAAAAAVAIAVGSAGTSQAATPKAASAPSQVTLCVNGLPYGSFIVNDVLLGEKLLKPVEKKYHTKFTFPNFPNSTTAGAALASGSCDLAIVYGTNVPKFAAAGINLRGIIAISSGVDQVLLAPSSMKAHGTGEKGIKSFAGATWALPSIGGLGNSIQIALLKHYKMSTPSDIVTGSDTGTVAALETGRATLGDPTTTAVAGAISPKKLYVVQNLGDPTFVHSVLPALAFASNEVVSTPTFIKKYKALTTDIVAAYVKAIRATQQLANYPAKAYALYPSSYRQGVSRYNFATTWALVAPTISGTTGLVTESQASAQAKFLNEVGTITDANYARFTSSFPNGVYDNSFVRAAYKELGLKLPKAKG